MRGIWTRLHRLNHSASFRYRKCPPQGQWCLIQTLGAYEVRRQPVRMRRASDEMKARFEAFMSDKSS